MVSRFNLLDYMEQQLYISWGPFLRMWFSLIYFKG